MHQRSYQSYQIWMVWLYLLICGMSSARAHTEDGCICLEEFASGLRDPILAIHANDKSGRLFIAEQIGMIHVYLEDKTKLEEPFLDIQSQVLVDADRRGDERGFLGLAFHPDHASNGKLYVYYSIRSQEQEKIRISELKTLPDDENKVDNGTERIILEVVEPQSNHNGGQLLFGLDGYLYAFLGDGGGGGDEHGEYGNGQNLTTLLAKVLRIDIDRQEKGLPYAIPPDNPFVKDDNSIKRHEIYAYGVRNMWRCCVDRGDSRTGYGRGRIFCGDVGQDLYEEVDIIVNGGNYGWRGKEGYECYDIDLCYNLENEVLPIDVYDHTVGRSLTGGYVYRGCQSPALQGTYIYGDYANGRMFTLTEKHHKWTREDVCFGSDAVCTDGLVNTYPIHILAFGEDEEGEVYMLTTDEAKSSNPGGKVFRIVDPSGKGNCAVDNDNTNNDILGSQNVNSSEDTNAWSDRGLLWVAFGIAVIVLMVGVISMRRNSCTKEKITKRVKRRLAEENRHEPKETSPLLGSAIADH